MSNKVKFGLKNVHYAMKKESGYDTVKTIPGAVSISLEPQGELYKFFADDVEYFTTSTNNGYEGDVEAALIPDDFRIDVLGDTLDSNNVLAENADAISKEFAFGFEFAGDDKAIRYWLLNCVAQRPKEEGETKENSISVKTEEFTLSARPNKDGVVRTRTTDTTKAETYSKWFESVYTPVAKA